MLKTPRQLLMGVALLVGATMAAGGLRADATTARDVNYTGDALRPNIVVILVDDMGFSDLGCFGSEIRTPVLDSLGEQGLRFTEMHNTSKCFPSRACLITGVYAQQCGMSRGYSGIVNAVTFGEVLQGAGYTTLWAGKHHSTKNPYFRGFDHYAGLRDGACNFFNPGLQREGEPMPAQKRYGGRTFCFDEKTVQPFTPEDPDFYMTDAFTDWAMEWLDELERPAANADTSSATGSTGVKPFFLYMAYNAPHDPLMAPVEDIERYEGVYDVGYEPIRESRFKRQVEMGLFDPDVTPLSPAEFPDWESMDSEMRETEIRRMQVYAAMVDRMDQNVGRLIEKIRQIGRLDNTLIIFTSDNGASSEQVNIGKGEIGSVDRWSSQCGRWANVSNTPLRKFKNFSYEGGIKTPMIAWWPDVIESGRITPFLGHFIDIMPTLVELSGAEYPTTFNDEQITPMQGVSLLPVLRDEKAEPKREQPLFWQWAGGRAVREGRWKLISQKGDWELYDMQIDRTETNDLAGQYPERVERMTRLWQEWFDSCQK